MYKKTTHIKITNISAIKRSKANTVHCAQCTTAFILQIGVGVDFCIDKVHNIDIKYKLG